MHRLISWTGWTKEDWIENLKTFVEYLAFSVILISMFFIPGLLG